MTPLPPPIRPASWRGPSMDESPPTRNTPGEMAPPGDAGRGERKRWTECCQCIPVRACDPKGFVSHSGRAGPAKIRRVYRTLVCRCLLAGRFEGVTETVVGGGVAIDDLGLGGGPAAELPLDRGPGRPTFGAEDSAQGDHGADVARGPMHAAALEPRFHDELAGALGTPRRRNSVYRGWSGRASR